MALQVGQVAGEEPTKSNMATDQYTSWQCTWRIIPFSKWLITIVSKSPKWGYSPSKWPKWLVNRGYQPLTKWDDPPSTPVESKYCQHKMEDLIFHVVMFQWTQGCTVHFLKKTCFGFKSTPQKRHLPRFQWWKQHLLKWHSITHAQKKFHPTFPVDLKHEYESTSNELHKYTINSHDRSTDNFPAPVLPIKSENPKAPKISIP